MDSVQALLNDLNQWYHTKGVAMATAFLTVIEDTLKIEVRKSDGFLGDSERSDCYFGIWDSSEHVSGSGSSTCVPISGTLVGCLTAEQLMNKQKNNAPLVLFMIVMALFCLVFSIQSAFSNQPNELMAQSLKTDKRLSTHAVDSEGAKAKAKASSGGTERKPRTQRA